MFDLARVVDAVMALTAAECLLLWAWHRFTGKGLQPADYALSLLSGLLLMGALRGVLTPGAEGLAWLCLAGSGMCHALDLRQRWRRARAASAASRGALAATDVGANVGANMGAVPGQTQVKGAVAQAG